ncbi:MAG: AAA family ATPase [Acholeplasmatales bacterium]|jgi:ATP-dependent Zn protease|nr:AAA family ATPase [Acholeplasmatales bacterium]
MDMIVIPYRREKSDLVKEIGVVKENVIETNLFELVKKINTIKVSLSNIIFGQDYAIDQFCKGLFQAETFDDNKKPKGIFLFAGPSGSGKTYLAEEGAKLSKRPFKRFDMSTYSNHNMVPDIAGWSPGYTNSKVGILTGFVEKNPTSILIFDEIEKAHIDAIHYFLQILDFGTLKDNFTGKEVDFSKTIVIFTTNAGKQLYDESERINFSGLSRNVILDAIKNDKGKDNLPFFPNAIISRLNTGVVVLFNKLPANELEKIGRKEFDSVSKVISEKYKIIIEDNGLLPYTLLLSRGSSIDARGLKALVKSFVKEQIYDFISFNSPSDLKKIRFEVNAISKENLLNSETNADLDVVEVFHPKQVKDILVFSKFTHFQIIKNVENFNSIFYEEDLPSKSVLTVEIIESIKKVIRKKKIDLIIIDPLLNLDYRYDENTITSKYYEFTYTIITEIFKEYVDIPIYLLNASNLKDIIINQFYTLGVQGVINFDSDLEFNLREVMRKLALQNGVNKIEREHKVLDFVTDTKIVKDVGIIELRKFKLKQNINAEDSSSILTDINKPKTKFNDVIGSQNVKDDLKEFIKYLNDPESYLEEGRKIPKGILFYGPPGTGKTLLARALAGETNCTFIPIESSKLGNTYINSASLSITNAFSLARKYAPSILFLDEIDAIGKERTGLNNREDEKALNTLLTELDGFIQNKQRPVLVVAATNFPIESNRKTSKLDDALVRRFDRRFLIELPNEENRISFLTSKLNKLTINKTTKRGIESIAVLSFGKSLAILEQVIELAIRNAYRKDTKLTDEVLNEAFHIFNYGEEREKDLDYLTRVAWHETGHAFISYKLGNAPEYITIISRSNYGGYVLDGNTTKASYNVRELENMIEVALGGRASEIVRYDEITGNNTGASQDLEQATNLAKEIVSKLGMTKEVGLQYLSHEEEYLGPKAIVVASYIEKLLATKMEDAKKLIESNIKLLENFVDVLLKKNSLTKEEMIDLFKE